MPISDTLFQFFWFFIKEYKLYWLGFFAVAFVWSLNLSLTPYSLKLIVDGVSNWNGTGSLFYELAFPTLFYLGLISSTWITFRFYDYLIIKTHPSLQYKIREEMFNYVERHSYRYFQNSFAGSLANKINDMAVSASHVFNHIIDHFLARALALLMGVFTLFSVHPYFAAILLIWVVIFMATSIVLSKKSKKYSEVHSEARSVLVGKMVDSITNNLNVKLFAREKFESDYLRTYLKDNAEKSRQSRWYLFKVKTFYAISILFLVSSFLWLLVYERQLNRITIGDFALVLMLTMWLIEEVFFIANQLAPFSEDLGTCQQAFSIISQKHEIIDIPNAKDLKVFKGEIVFDKVNFQYKKEKNVFVDKSVRICPGERVGLVGFSGSGKSTFVNLILRFFDVDSGQILIDDQDIKNVTQESLRSQIAMIPQDPALFHRSLFENIAYGKIGASVEEVLIASKKAHCHEFIESLPDGYHSLVGERGVKLSGGQRQRIAIARAILKDAPILILDEATSSLDSITENFIQNGMNELMQNRTTIVIAHRLSTLFHMDRILVFNEGKIVEDGSHAELLKLEGHYCKMWSMQAGGFIAHAIPDEKKNGSSLFSFTEKQAFTNFESR